MPRKKRVVQHNVLEYLYMMIFIASVALVVFILFSGGLRAKSEELRRLKVIDDFKTSLNLERQACGYKCDTAWSSGCEEDSVAQFCLISVELDVEHNGKFDYSENIIPGTGVCEDKVFCSQLVSCDCVQGMRECIDFLCHYWKERDMDGSKALNMNLVPGSCDYLNEPLHWYNQLRTSEGLACS
ncbi:MAG: hypothetical protein V1837_04265 [Candidatus Woesearchaeota archaeon]